MGTPLFDSASRETGGVVVVSKNAIVTQRNQVTYP